MKTPSKIMIHHTAVSYQFNHDQFTANNSYHKNQGFPKSSMGFYLGYNYEISMSGFLRQARKCGEVTAACYQANMNDGRCVHIALDGNFDREKPAPNQIYKLRDQLRLLVKQYKINVLDIVFHNQFAPKSCPGKNMDLAFIRSLAR